MGFLIAERKKRHH